MKDKVINYLKENKVHALVIIILGIAAFRGLFAC